MKNLYYLTRVITVRREHLTLTYYIINDARWSLFTFNDRRVTYGTSCFKQSQCTELQRTRGGLRWDSVIKRPEAYLGVMQRKLPENPKDWPKIGLESWQAWPRIEPGMFYLPLTIDSMLTTRLWSTMPRGNKMF